MLATAHISLVLSRLIQAFVVHVNDDGGAIIYLADIAQPLNRSKDMIYITLVRLLLLNTVQIIKKGLQDRPWRYNPCMEMLYGLE